ncbi:hypothetical protein JOE59_002737 [Agromyces cerinus]|uniref:hypothetical protein n=1 Tax=Agromyces cerinus TaxID=33878 RepID=UPI0019585AFD|nr:hypothetical protein [Agromyces cerinus]MBM7832032.1 hypothetical protein [Agromyces cerinus]
MSILHTVTWLRHRYTGPWSRDAWPEATVMEAGDVRISTISLLGVAASHGTPCVRNAAAVVPGTGGAPSPSQFASVVVTRVLAVETLPDDSLGAWVDADLDRCSPLLSEARIIGRPSIEATLPVQLRPSITTAAEAPVAALPIDLHPGDLIAVPCRGATSLRDIRPSSRHRSRLSDDRIDHDRDEFPLGHCGR